MAGMVRRERNDDYDYDFGADDGFGKGDGSGDGGGNGNDNGDGGSGCLDDPFARWKPKRRDRSRGSESEDYDPELDGDEYGETDSDEEDWWKDALADIDDEEDLSDGGDEYDADSDDVMMMKIAMKAASENKGEMEMEVEMENKATEDDEVMEDWDAFGFAREALLQHATSSQLSGKKRRSGGVPRKPNPSKEETQKVRTRKCRPSITGKRIQEHEPVARLNPSSVGYRIPDDQVTAKQLAQRRQHAKRVERYGGREVYLARQRAYDRERRKVSKTNPTPESRERKKAETERWLIKKGIPPGSEGYHALYRDAVRRTRAKRREKLIQAGLYRRPRLTYLPANNDNDVDDDIPLSLWRLPLNRLMRLRIAPPPSLLHGNVLPRIDRASVLVYSPLDQVIDNESDDDVPLSKWRLPKGYTYRVSPSAYGGNFKLFKSVMTSFRRDNDQPRLLDNVKLVPLPSNASRLVLLQAPTALFSHLPSTIVSNCSGGNVNSSDVKTSSGTSHNPSSIALNASNGETTTSLSGYNSETATIPTSQTPLTISIPLHQVRAATTTGSGYVLPYIPTEGLEGVERKRAPFSAPPPPLEALTEEQRRTRLYVEKYYERFGGRDAYLAKTRQQARLNRMTVNTPHLNEKARMDVLMRAKASGVLVPVSSATDSNTLQDVSLTTNTLTTHSTPASMLFTRLMQDHLGTGKTANENMTNSSWQPTLELTPNRESNDHKHEGDYMGDQGGDDGKTEQQWEALRVALQLGLAYNPTQEDERIAPAAIPTTEENGGIFPHMVEASNPTSTPVLSTIVPPQLDPAYPPSLHMYMTNSGQPTVPTMYMNQDDSGPSQS